MAQFVKGDIVVVVPFPFSDLSGSKRRPAMVLSDLSGDDILLCQITSQNSRDPLSVLLSTKDFVTGSLPVESFIRPSRIFTADKNIIVRTAGSVNKNIVRQVVERIVNLLN
jgi:mRNA interferase MazF